MAHCQGLPPQKCRAGASPPTHRIARASSVRAFSISHACRSRRGSRDMTAARTYGSAGGLDGQPGVRQPCRAAPAAAALHGAAHGYGGCGGGCVGGGGHCGGCPDQHSEARCQNARIGRARIALLARPRDPEPEIANRPQGGRLTYPAGHRNEPSGIGNNRVARSSKRHGLSFSRPAEFCKPVLPRAYFLLCGQRSPRRGLLQLPEEAALSLWIVAVPFDTFQALPCAKSRWLLTCFSRYVDRDGKVFPSLRQLARDARMSLASVSRYMTTMERLGVFQRQRRPGGRYTYVWPKPIVRAGPGRVPAPQEGVSLAARQQAKQRSILKCDSPN